MKVGFLIISFAMAPFCLSGEDLFLSFGGGASVSNDHVTEVVNNDSLNQTGDIDYDAFEINAFLDVTRFLSFSLGARFATTPLTFNNFDYKGTVTDYSLSAIQFDIGVEAKYPFQILRNCYLSPAIGMKYMYLVSGNVGGQSPTTDMAQLLNPLFFTLGGDLDYYFHANYFLRVNYTVGIGLNAKLSDSFYSPGTYVSSSSILNSVGVSFGCALD